jgi:raffinose/stachyose/melibiose transport system substrate-binding protein
MNSSRAIVIATVLIGLAFLYSAWRIHSLSGPGQAVAGTVELRLAHYLVYESHRVHYAGVIRDYEARNPGIRIRVTDVPIRVWPTWRKTQLDSPTPPDIVQLGMGFTDEQTALYVRPLTREVQEPNPYHRGTDLERVPWRETFIDGLRGSGDNSETYNYRLLDYYGVPTYANTIRLFCNLDLLERLTGETTVPVDYDGFVSLLGRIATESRRSRLQITAMAGADEYSRLFFHQLFQQQSQRLARGFDLERNLAPSDRESAIALLRGVWGPARPPVSGIWSVWRDAGQGYQPGFLTALREDAGFLFKQQRAVMAVSGSWDALFLLSEVPFRAAAFPVPVPDAAHPTHGAGVVGPIGEAALVPSGSFGIMRRSRHPREALDFLHFLTSRPINQRFADECLRIPVVRGARPAGSIAAFAPRADGFEPGFSPYFQYYGRRAAFRTLLTNLHRLFAPAGGVQPFIAGLAETYEAAIRSDSEAFVRDGARASQRTDTVVLAWHALDAGGDTGASSRLALAAETQSAGESDYLQTQHALLHAAAFAPKKHLNDGRTP